jgi:hypothetical protein
MYMLLGSLAAEDCAVKRYSSLLGTDSFCFKRLLVGELIVVLASVDVPRCLLFFSGILDFISA